MSWYASCTVLCEPFLRRAAVGVDTSAKDDGGGMNGSSPAEDSLADSRCRCERVIRRGVASGSYASCNERDARLWL
jgi:hypothetical protein